MGCGPQMAPYPGRLQLAGHTPSDPTSSGHLPHFVEKAANPIGLALLARATCGYLNLAPMDEDVCSREPSAFPRRLQITARSAI